MINKKRKQKQVVRKAVRRKRNRLRVSSKKMHLLLRDSETLFEREDGSSCFILKRGMTLMKENWFERSRTFINNSIPLYGAPPLKTAWSSFYIWCLISFYSLSSFRVL
eukprot:NODE_5_length_49639_cov_0.484336.p30 type:complete len:108 gc:universal NODE_5_length_49639_cov_0.484336:5074-4751(-)